VQGETAQKSDWRLFESLSKKANLSKDRDAKLPALIYLNMAAGLPNGTIYYGEKI